MLSLGHGTRVFVALDPVDMRGSFDALAGAARRLGLELVDGHLYLFFNRQRRLCKAVWFDGSGWCLFSVAGGQKARKSGENRTHRRLRATALRSLRSCASFRL